MARETLTAGTRTVPCNHCDTDVNARTETASTGICSTCVQERASELLADETHEVECRDCGEATETAERFDSTTCVVCLGEKAEAGF